MPVFAKWPASAEVDLSTRSKCSLWVLAMSQGQEQQFTPPFPCCRSLFLEPALRKPRQPCEYSISLLTGSAEMAPTSKLLCRRLPSLMTSR